MNVQLIRWVPPLTLSLPAIVSGILLALAFPPVSFGPLSFVALIPLLVALHKVRRSPGMYFKTGHLFGVTFFAAHLWWIVRLDDASSITFPVLMIPAVLVLVLYLAVYPAFFCLLLRVIGRGRRLLIVFLAPALWMLLEWMRSSGELGFPWAALGYSLARFPSLVQSASLFGVTGVGAMIVLVNMIWSNILLSKNINAKTAFAVAGIALVAVNTLMGKQTIGRYIDSQRREVHSVALVQPDVDLALKWKPEFTDSTFRLIERLADRAAIFEPGIIVFPETSAPVYIRHDQKYKYKMETIAKRNGIGIFIGFLDGRYDGPGGKLEVYNSCGLFSPDGDLNQYDKIHLLPFGEAIPFGWKFKKLRSMDFGQANFQPGTRTQPIPSPVGNLAPLICFESLFPSLTREFTLNGADVFVNITNDGWFGNTPGPYQHNDMAILRSVENRRFLIRSANTGVTMVVDPVGRVIGTLGVNREGLLVESISPVDYKTVYTRYGDAPLMAASLVIVVLGIILVWLGRRRRAQSEV